MMRSGGKPRGLSGVNLPGGPSGASDAGYSKRWTDVYLVPGSNDTGSACRTCRQLRRHVGLSLPSVIASTPYSLRQSCAAKIPLGRLPRRLSREEELPVLMRGRFEAALA